MSIIDWFVAFLGTIGVTISRAELPPPESIVTPIVNHVHYVDLEGGTFEIKYLMPFQELRELNIEVNDFLRTKGMDTNIEGSILTWNDDAMGGYREYTLRIPPVTSPIFQGLDLAAGGIISAPVSSYSNAISNYVTYTGIFSVDEIRNNFNISIDYFPVHQLSSPPPRPAPVQTEPEILPIRVITFEE